MNSVLRVFQFLPSKYFQVVKRTESALNILTVENIIKITINLWLIFIILIFFVKQITQNK